MRLVHEKPDTVLLQESPSPLIGHRAVEERAKLGNFAFEIDGFTPVNPEDSMSDRCRNEGAHMRTAQHCILASGVVLEPLYDHQLFPGMERRLGHDQDGLGFSRDHTSGGDYSQANYEEVDKSGPATVAAIAKQLL